MYIPSFTGIFRLFAFIIFNLISAIVQVLLYYKLHFTIGFAWNIIILFVLVLIIRKVIPDD